MATLETSLEANYDRHGTRKATYRGTSYRSAQKGKLSCHLVTKQSFPHFLNRDTGNTGSLCALQGWDMCCPQSWSKVEVETHPCRQEDSWTRWEATQEGVLLEMRSGGWWKESPADQDNVQEEI